MVQRCLRAQIADVGAQHRLKLKAADSIADQSRAVRKQDIHGLEIVEDRRACAGLAIFFLGVAIAFTDLIRSGGWPLVGVIIAIMGMIDAVLAPRMLKRLWEEQDRGR